MADVLAGFIEFSGVVLAATGITVSLWAAVRGLAVRPAPDSATEIAEPSAVDTDPWLEAAKLPFKHEMSA